jgi:hypothetical protein
MSTAIKLAIIVASSKEGTDVLKGKGKRVVPAKAAPSPKNGDSNEVVATSVRIPKALHERLRKLSFDKRIGMTTYIERGIEMVLKAEKY